MFHIVQNINNILVMYLVTSNIMRNLFIYLLIYLDIYWDMGYLACDNNSMQQ